MVPGLLQTAEYTRHVLAITDIHGWGDHAAAVAARMERQQILYKSARRFEFLLTEAAVRLRLGPPHVMQGRQPASAVRHELRPTGMAASSMRSAEVAKAIPWRSCHLLRPPPATGRRHSSRAAEPFPLGLYWTGHPAGAAVSAKQTGMPSEGCRARSRRRAPAGHHRWLAATGGLARGGRTRRRRLGQHRRPGGRRGPHDRKRYPPPGRMVNVDGRALHLLDMGVGSPAVVFIQVLGANCLELGLPPARPRTASARCASLCMTGPVSVGAKTPSTATETHDDMARDIASPSPPRRSLRPTCWPGTHSWATAHRFAVLESRRCRGHPAGSHLPRRPW